MQIVNNSEKEKLNFIKEMKARLKESAFMLCESVYQLICLFFTENVVLTPLYCDLTVVKQDLLIIWCQPLC